MSEEDRRAAESSRIGAEGGRISAESGRVSADTARAHEDTLRHRKDVGQLLAYVLIVAVGAWGFYNDEKHDEQICNTARENRTAITSVVMAIDTLGRSLIVEGKPRDKWSLAEIDSINALTRFRESQMKLLDKPVC